MKRFLFIISAALLLVACGNSAADEMLDSYERLADKCVLYMKNAKNGNSDEQVLKEILKDLQEMQLKAAELEGGFTKAQRKRYVEITQKFSTATMEMY